MSYQKYKIDNETIPQKNRKEINEKILYLVNNNLCEKYSITVQDVFSSYTGDGGLTGLNFKDYNSFHDYTKAKQEVENGQFFTPPGLAKYLIDMLQPSEYQTILDLTCGHGSFFNCLPNENNIYGNELDMKAYKVAKFLYPDANLTHGDMREYTSKIKFDYIIGNPPFNLRLRYNDEDQYSQMIYIKKSLELLKTGGLLALIVPFSFLNDEFSNKSDIEYMNNNYNFVCQIKLDNNAFSYLGVENFPTKIIIFQKKSQYLDDKKYVNGFVEGDSQYIHANYINPIMENIEKSKHKIFLENVNIDQQDIDKESTFNVNKLLFDIKRTKSVNDKYSECKTFVEEYYAQKKPENMKWDEWNEIKIKKEQVIHKLKTVLSNQYVKEVDKIKLVKTNYTLKYKAYSQNTEKYLDRINDKEVSFNDMILNDNYCFDDKNYLKLFNKKKKEYLRQNRKFREITEDENIKSYLNSTYLYDHENDEKIYLNEKQLIDTNKTLQKKYDYLQWEQGSGKTITGIFQAKYRLKYNNVKNIFVVAPAIAIKNTWSVMLDNFKINNIIINQLSDINNIKRGQFVLITFNMLIKYQRFIKKYLKMNNRKFMLILDEADGISNTNSKRTKATLNCFRKLPYKLLLSGTSTRNSINEIFPQLELLYNNSINMLSKSEYIYSIDKDDPESLREENNIYYMKPIPPYKKGFEVFSNSHVPKKISVFGVSKYNQNIYNKDILKEIIDKTIITRTLKDITGRELYNIHQITCKFNQAEKDLYTMILEEFYQMSAEYHIHTGNSRKDSLFRILAQLNTLLKACSIPHSFKEYNDYRLSSKFSKVFQLLNKFHNECVAIGCIRIKTVKLYENEIKKLFPNRPLFVITGNETSMKERRKIVRELKKYPNAILLSTQQSLSCSMNIGFIDKVIIPEMNWNDSSMGQYRGRFIRMNSDNVTDVYNVLYDGSIENNLLKLVMCKEKLNLFMKNQDLQDDELFEKYGIDNWLFNCLMTKEKDSEGNIKITWGEQNII